MLRTLLSVYIYMETKSISCSKFLKFLLVVDSIVTSITPRCLSSYIVLQFLWHIFSKFHNPS